VNALIATVIVIGSRPRVDEAASALDELRDRGGVRRVLISEGAETRAQADEQDTTIRVDGLSPQYVDNAVAWLRLSSLPAVVWWRGGAADALERLAHLADRLVVDTDPPDEMWGRLPALFDRTAVTDLRWSSLTRWRSAMAHLFDVESVRASVPAMRRLEVAAADRAAARLFAGWLCSCLRDLCTLDISIGAGEPDARTPLSRVRLSGDGVGITLQVRGAQTCLEAELDGAGGARVVPLGATTLASRFAEEIGVRTRDAAFERALLAAMETRS